MLRKSMLLASMPFRVGLPQSRRHPCACGGACHPCVCGVPCGVCGGHPGAQRGWNQSHRGSQERARAG